MILLSPWSRCTPAGQRSPKDYPWWPEVVARIPGVVQVSQSGESDVPGCVKRLNDLPLQVIAELIKRCRAWISVDNFFHHFAWSLGVKGVVVWGQSDPEIFGHSQNVNLLLSRKHLRARQFGLWSEVEWRPEVFVKPEAVIEAVQHLLANSP